MISNIQPHLWQSEFIRVGQVGGASWAINPFGVLAIFLNDGEVARFVWRPVTKLLYFARVAVLKASMETDTSSFSQRAVGSCIIILRLTLQQWMK